MEVYDLALFNTISEHNILTCGESVEYNYHEL